MGGEVNTRRENRRVLLVDGNWMFRHAAALALSCEGYEVLEAITAKEGLDVMAAEKGRIDIVMSEVFFRGEINGPTLVKALRKITPELKCIFVSGYSKETLEDILGKDEPHAFLLNLARRGSLQRR